MNARTLRARRLLRTARRGPWGNGRNGLINAMQPVHGADGEIRHYRIVTDPWHTYRTGSYRSGTSTSWKTKAGQRWVKECAKGARWDMNHALSDCCGWGKEEVYHETIEFVGSIIPTRNRMPNFKENC